MVGATTKVRSLSSQSSIIAGVSSTPPQQMYLLEGGLLVVSNLLKTNAWVQDTDRSHCNVCMQQFMPFRRRHHCRTCGEVVCGNCSSQRKIHLIEVNVECATRVCSFCMIRATDASIHETSSRGVTPKDHDDYVNVARVIGPGGTAVAMQPPLHGRHASQPQPHASVATTKASTPPGSPLDNNLPLPPRPQHRTAQSPPPPPPPPVNRGRVSKQFSMLSLESELTDGSVVQLWPPPVAASSADEAARLAIARNATIRQNESENDPTMALLVSIVARTLECPVAFIGILDATRLWFKAAVGFGERTHIARDDCVCVTQSPHKTMIVADTNQDKHFHANTLCIGRKPMRYYAGAPIKVLGQCIGAVCAIDTAPHWETSAAMKSTLEAVANIVSEVLEQRVDGKPGSGLDPLVSLAVAQQKQNVPREERAPTVTSSSSSMTASTVSPVKRHPVTQTGFQFAPARPASPSSFDSESTLLDVEAAMRNLRTTEGSFSSLDSDEEDEFAFADDMLEQRASETAPPSTSSASSSGAVHPWPSSAGTTSFSGRMSLNLLNSAPSLPRFSLAIPVGPPEIGEKVAKAMEFFQALQSSRWASANDSFDEQIRSFDLFTQGRHFTKSHATILGDCTHVIASLQSYDDPRLYSDLFAQVTQRRQKVNVQTWIDHVQLCPGFEASHYSEVKVLSHWRQYPDGSNIVVAFNDSNPELLMVEDFLFGWFISPSAPDVHGNCCVNVTSLIAEPLDYENQSGHDDEALNLSKTMLQRLNDSLPHHYDISSMVSVASEPSVASSCSSSDNQHTHDYMTMMNGASSAPTDSLMMHGMGMTTRPTSTSAGEKMVAIRSKYSEVSSLNSNERMMLDLLDKTISTQEVLAAQQHVMANVMDYHGSQLERISSAIDRVENILHTNGDKLKQMGTFRSQVKENRRENGRESVSRGGEPTTGNRHSISL